MAAPVFGTVLKRLRKEAGLSQEALAERAGVSSHAVSALERGLRTTPYPKTVALFVEALGLGERGGKQLEEAAKQARAGRAISPTLPHLVAPLVGRAEESAAIARLLLAHRLVSITGPGGIGKTSIAIAAGRAASPEFSDGVAFCDLSVLSDGTSIASTIATACSLTSGPGEPTAEAVATQLGASARLLVLDNCEHLTQPVNDAVTALLTACPRLSILTTTRRRLRLPYEVAYALPPLALPGDAAVSSMTAHEAIRFGAIQLFIERASAANPAFVLDDETASVVARICRQLDGLPLGIEIAAAQLRVMSIAELHERLSRHLKLSLDGRAGTIRHKTLRAAFEWSYALLAERERRFFRAVGVFTGDFTFEAAHDVCCEPGTGELDALELLAALVDASLLTVDSSEPVSRYRLLETTREYALACTNQQERADLATRHLEHYRRVAYPGLLSLELPDVRAALAWSLGSGNALAGAELLANLGGHWAMIGLATEGITWLDTLIAAVPACDLAMLARLWTVKALVIGNRQRYAEALELAKRGLELAREAGDERILFNALRATAVLSAWLGKHREAQQAASQAAAAAASTPALRLSVLIMYGTVLRHLNRPQEAIEAFNEARNLARASDQPFREVEAALLIGESEHERGCTEVALELLQQLRTNPRLRGIDDEPLLANLAGYAIALGDTRTPRLCARSLFAIDNRGLEAAIFVTGMLEHIALTDAVEGNLDRAALLEGYCAAWYRNAGFDRQYTEQKTHERLVALLSASDAAKHEGLQSKGSSLSASSAIVLALADAPEQRATNAKNEAAFRPPRA